MRLTSVAANLHPYVCKVSLLQKSNSLLHYKMDILILVSFVFCLLSCAQSASYSRKHDDGAVRTIYEFPNETWIENIAVRKNGNILTTLITVPEVWEINPFTSKAELVHRFDTVTSVFGIAEVECDLFAVALGNWSYERQVQPGTWSIWAVDLRGGGEAGVQKVTDIPEAHYLEGMTALPSSPGTILSADSTLGLIYRVNIFAGQHSIAIENEAFKPAKNAIVPLGINGIHIPQNRWPNDSEQEFLYFVNTFGTPFLGRMPIDSEGSATGSVEEIAKYAPAHVEGDDFALDSDGYAWVTTNSANSVLKVDIRSGEVRKAIGGEKQSVVAGADSVAFGRTFRDSKTLYITTTGGIVVPPSTGIVGGKIVALDTKRSHF